MVVARGWWHGEILFDEYRTLVLQDENSGDWLYNNVNVLNTTQCYALKWLRWWILCYVYFWPFKNFRSKKFLEQWVLSEGLEICIFQQLLQIIIFSCLLAVFISFQWNGSSRLLSIFWLDFVSLLLSSVISYIFYIWVQCEIYGLQISFS